MHQLLKSYQDSLNKFNQSMGSLYGSVAGIRILGPEVWYFSMYLTHLLPVLYFFTLKTFGKPYGFLIISGGRGM